MPIVLGLDLGTSKLCALALSTDARRVLAVRSAPNDADVPDLPPDRHEQDPAKILDRSLGLVRELLAGEAVAAGEVAGLCVAGQMHGVLLVDRGLQPVTPLITWRDRRALKPTGPGNIEQALADVDESGQSRTGCRLHPGYGGLTLHRLAKNGRLPGGALALSLADFVTAALTGVVATEPTHAASWGILDVERGRWDSELVGRLGIPEAVLPEIRPSAMPLGELLAEQAEALGLARTVRVLSPVGDNQASVIGAVGFGAGTCVVNLGTGGQVSLPSSEFRSAPPLETRPMPFGGYILVGASLCGGWSYEYLRRFYQDVAREMTGRELADADADACAYERLNALARKAPPGAGGLRADTRFGGSRSEPGVSGAVAGIDTENLTPGNLARAVLEGMVRELADMARLADGLRVERVVASGGAVRKNPLVKEVTGEMFGAPCEVGPAREEAALGAAYCAAVGLGLLRAGEVNEAPAVDDGFQQG